jgi:hypothetical protein
VKKFKKGASVWFAGPRDRKPVKAVVNEDLDGEISAFRDRDLKLVSRDRSEVWASQEQAWLVCRDNAIADVADAQKRLRECERVLALFNRAAK